MSGWSFLFLEDYELSKSQIEIQIFIFLFTEYTDDNALIPKNSSVIVRRIPIGGVKSTSKTYVM